MFPATGPEPPPSYVDNAPTLTSNDGEGGTQGTWNGTVTDNHAEWTGGAVRYTFPTAEGFDIDDYDFFEIEYTDGGGNVILKQLTTGTGFGFVSNPYPNLNAEGGTFKFEIRGAGTSGGIAFQRNNGDASITITKVTFTKGERVTITFDVDGGSEVASITNAVVDTVVGPLPSTTKGGFTFARWVDAEDEDTTVTSATVVPAGGLALKAIWNAAVSVTQIPVNLSTGVTATGGALSDQSATSFTFTYTAAYGGAYAKFSVPLATGASLADYGSVTVTINGLSGDSNYKTVWLLAGQSITGSISPDPSNDHPLVVGSNGNSTSGSADERYTQGSVTRTIAIAAGKGSDLTGTVELCVYLHAGGTGSGNATAYTFSNITLNPKE